MKFSVILISILVSINSFANECTIKKISPDSVTEYLVRVAQTINILKAYQAKENSKSDQIKENDYTENMIYLKEMRERYLCTSAAVASYSKSKNKGVAASSKILSQGYKDLASSNQHMIDTTKSMMNSVITNNLKAGDLADRVSDNEIAKKKAWKKVYEGIDIGVQTILDKTKKIDSKDKKDSKEENPNEWRDDIINELKKSFTVPIKEQKDAFDQMANYLYEGISLKEPAK